MVMFPDLTGQEARILAVLRASWRSRESALKLYMKTNTYIDVNDNWFWKKMLYAMPKVPIDKLKADDKDFVPKVIDNPEEQGLRNVRHGIEQNDRDEGTASDEDDVTNSDDDITGSDDDVTGFEEYVTDSDDNISSDSDVEAIRMKVYKRPSNRNAVARLPPLFKRIHTFNQVERAEEA